MTVLLATPNRPVKIRRFGSWQILVKLRVPPHPFSADSSTIVANSVRFVPHCGLQEALQDGYAVLWLC